MNHYESIILKIGQLINEKKDDEALELVNKELDVPYVPKEIEELLLSYKDELTPPEPMKYIDLSAEEIEAFLFGDDQLKISQALVYLQKANIRNHLDIVEKVLGSEEVDEVLKNTLLSILIDQGVNKEIFILYNSGKQIKINPSKTEQFLSDDVIGPTHTLLDDVLEGHDVSLLATALSLLDLVVLQIYPHDIIYDYRSFAMALAMKANELTGHSTSIDELAGLFNEFPETLESHLERLNKVF